MTNSYKYATAVILGAGVMFAAVHAEAAKKKDPLAERCKPSLKIEGNGRPLWELATGSARKNWRRKAEEMYGAEYAVWENAADLKPSPAQVETPGMTCGKGTGFGMMRCIAEARPCLPAQTKK